MYIFIAKALATLLSADFISGLVHWWEDTYGNPRWPILGKYIVEPNLLHHTKPREFLKGTYWTRNNTALICAAVLVGVPAIFGWFNWFYTACILVASQSNEIHRKAHQSDAENGPLIAFLQKLGLMQSRRHHGWHHAAPYDCHFCIITNYLNPVLERIHFFPVLEWIIEKFFRIQPLRAKEERGGR
ncbi:MAG: fatty acid desaturase family protein [Bacteroidetes bacterium]|nr:fatty acid desaturase family protein [Bacteroidota bacterium]